MTVCLSTIRIIVPLFLLLKLVITIIFIDYSQHEQSRTDRDDYITIHWENIIEGIDEPYSPQNRFVHINLIVLFIASGMALNFQKHDLGQIQYLGEPYNTGIIISVWFFRFHGFVRLKLGLSSFSTGSIMHYGAYDFAKDLRYPTITSKKDDGQQLGQREGFSNVCSIFHFQK